MSACCYPEEYGSFFDAREAGKVVRRYLKRGLTGTGLDLAEGLTHRGIEDKTILEVGGGAGQILADVLRRGARSGLSIDLSPHWEGPAGELLEKLALVDRVERLTGDFVDEAANLPGFDAVILHRVICCYPHWEAMLDAAMSLRPGLIAITMPRERVATKAVIAASNGIQKIRGKNFRVFVHPHQPMFERMAGYLMVYDRSRPIWRTAVLERTAVPNEIG